MTDQFAAQRLDGKVLVPLLSDAAQMITGSVIDFDQTVHGPNGAHVPVAA